MSPRALHRSTARAHRRARVGWLGAALVWVGSSGCTTGHVTAETPGERTSGASADANGARVVLTEVRLAPAVATAPFRWDAEARGLFTVAMELGLSDLPGVRPRLDGQAGSPAVVRAEELPQRIVDARLRIAPAASTPGGAAGEPVLRFALELCPTGGTCRTIEADGTRTQPWDAVGTLLDGAAETLGVSVSGTQRAAWRTPGSHDPYAELVTGRAAAVLVGISAWTLPAEGETDPTARAVRIDPRQPLAQWVHARWVVGAGGAVRDEGREDLPRGVGRAPHLRHVDALRAAMLARPSSPLPAADLATLEGLAGEPARAVLAWDEVERIAPGDPRFQLPAARALLATGRADLAEARLAGLGAAFAQDPAVSALRVQVAEARGTSDLDALLEHWQRVDPRAVEPVRRRLDLRVTDERWDEAEALLPALRARSPGDAVDALATALLAARGRFEEAARGAPPEVAARLRERAAIARGEMPEAWAAADGVGRIAAAAAVERAPREVLLRAERLLALGQADDALVLAQALVERDEDSASGWALRAQALDALGRVSLAQDAWARAWERDPALAGGPVETGRPSPPAEDPGQDGLDGEAPPPGGTVARIASTFRTVEGRADTAASPDAPKRARRAKVRRGGRKGPAL
ncbi:MAG: hypothetical protein RLZZ299_2556 [Pseudomonadota bacterium]|jgi:tetratricopeptide (TPR) repeat protein